MDLIENVASGTNTNFVMQVDSGKVDGEWLCITGGSAGGYTTLAALAFKETFKAGASLYGVSALSCIKFLTPSLSLPFPHCYISSDETVNLLVDAPIISNSFL